MSQLKEHIIQILWEKNSPIATSIIEHIDIFSPQELEHIYLIIHQTDIEKLKSLFLYQHSQAKIILDRIIQLAHETHHIDKHIEQEFIYSENQELEQYLEQNLDFNYVIS